MSVGSRIRALRVQNGIHNQEELAYLLGIARQTVSSWERGVFLPEGANLIRLAKILNTSVSYIMGETEDSKSMPVRTMSSTNKRDISYSMTARQASTVFVSAEKSDGHKTVRYGLPPDISAKMLPLFERLWKEIEGKIN